MLEADHGFDLLVLDHDTPDEGGFAFVDALQNNCRIAKLPTVLMLLPLMRLDLFDKIGAHGVLAAVGKPVIPSMLLKAVLDVFQLKDVSGTQPTAEAIPNPARSGALRRVLLADDNQTNQLIARSLLRQAGIEAITASDGQEAVLLFSQHRDTIGLVLMDLHMPVQNGYEAARAIREKAPDVPIVAMTADVVQDVRERCEQNGMQHYLSKPFDPDRFLQLIRSLLQTRADTGDAGEEMILDQAAGEKNMRRQAPTQFWRLTARRTGQEAAIGQPFPGRRYSDAAQIVQKLKQAPAASEPGLCSKRPGPCSVFYSLLVKTKYRRWQNGSRCSCENYGRKLRPSAMKCQADKGAGRDKMPVKILFADDSAADRLILKSMLPDYTVVTAVDGADALRQIRGSLTSTGITRTEQLTWTASKCSRLCAMMLA